MTKPVVIAGGGPVGLMLAHEFGLAGVPTVVIERLPEPRKHSRGAAINAGVIELLEQRGLMTEIRGFGHEIPTAHFAHLYLDPTRLSEPHPYLMIVPHSRIEAFLEQRATALGVEVRRSAEVTGLHQEDDGVVVTVRTADGEQRIEASYLVGCDGAHSTVRQLAGIDFPGIDPSFLGIYGDLEVPADAPLLGRLGINQYDTGFVTMVPTSPTSVRITIAEFDRDPDDPSAPASLKELAAGVERIGGFQLGPARAVFLERWETPTRHAVQYRSGRVLLAGDAARVFFPLGGQSLANGMEDAVNLGWKLAAVVQGRAPKDLLDSYHAERHPVGERACQSTLAQAALLYPYDRVRPLRDIFTELIKFDDVNAYLTKLASVLDVRYPMEHTGVSDHPLIGTRLPNYPLTTANGESSISQLMHAGRGVLLDMSGATTQWPLGDTDLIDVRTAKPSTDIDAEALLLRPDGRVAWAGTGGHDGLDAALRAWFHRP